MLNERRIKAYQSVCAVGLFCLLDQYYIFVGKYYHFECSVQEMRQFFKLLSDWSLLWRGCYTPQQMWSELQHDALSELTLAQSWVCMFVQRGHVINCLFYSRPTLGKMKILKLRGKRQRALVQRRWEMEWNLMLLWMFLPRILPKMPKNTLGIFLQLDTRL